MSEIIHDTDFMKGYSHTKCSGRDCCGNLCDANLIYDIEDKDYKFLYYSCACCGKLWKVELSSGIV